MPGGVPGSVWSAVARVRVVLVFTSRRRGTWVGNLSREPELDGIIYQFFQLFAVVCQLVRFSQCRTGKKPRLRAPVQAAFGVQAVIQRGRRGRRWRQATNVCNDVMQPGMNDHDAAWRAKLRQRLVVPRRIREDSRPNDGHVTLAWKSKQVVDLIDRQQRVADTTAVLQSVLRAQGAPPWPSASQVASQAAPALRQQ